MGLSVIDRGFLDKIIDKEIAEIPSQVKSFREPRIKTKFQLKEPNDFVFGVAFGTMLDSFSSYYTQIYQKPPTQSEIDEVVSVIDNRIAEIRNAIFNCG